MNPTERLNLITDIASKLQADYNTSEIDILLGGYGINTESVNSSRSKSGYVINLLKSQSNQVIIQIAKDLHFHPSFIDETSENEIEQEPNITLKMQKKIFISHSSHDADIVE